MRFRAHFCIDMRSTKEMTLVTYLILTYIHLLAKKGSLVSGNRQDEIFFIIHRPV